MATKKGIRFVDIKEKLNHKNENKKSRKSSKQLTLKLVNKTKDVFSHNLKIWKCLDNKLEKFLNHYQFDRIETPMIEYGDVILNGFMKNDSDLKKKLFFVEKSGEKTIVLRPELLAGMIRSYFENKMQNTSLTVKFFALGPVFLDNKDSLMSQYNQLCLEIIGDGSPIVDVELINTVRNLLDDFRVKNISIDLNNIGCEECRGEYEKEIKKYFKEKKTKLCSKCKKALSENIWDIFSCHEEKCKAVRSSLKHFDEFWCNDCKNHFKTVIEYLDYLKINYNINQTLWDFDGVKNKIIFKISFTENDKRYEFGYGFRHDDLIRNMSMTGRFGVGCVLDVNLLFKILRDQKQKYEKNEKEFSVFLIQIGDTAKRKAFEIMEELRKENISVKANLSKDSLRAQMNVAEKEKDDCILIIGQEEVMRGEVIIRDSQSGLQESVSFAKLIPSLLKRKNN